MEFHPGQKLSQISPDDKPWDCHKMQNSDISGLYGLNPLYRKYAERMTDCASSLVFGQVAENDDSGNLATASLARKRLKLVKANFCRVRLCPVCSWRKSLALLARFMAKIPEYVEALSQCAFLHITLTVKNPPLVDLRETIRHMNKSFNRLKVRKEIVPILRGVIKHCEITRGQDEQPHPHFHVIMAVPKSYFKSRHYLRHDVWVRLWRECLGVDYDPLVNVKKVKRNKRKKNIIENLGLDIDQDVCDLLGGLLEVIKYDAKPADLTHDVSYLYGITQQIKNLRFHEASGVFEGIFKNRNCENEDPSDDEMMLKNHDGDITNLRLVFGWDVTDYKLWRKFVVDN